MQTTTFPWESSSAIDPIYRNRLTRLVLECQTHDWDGVIFNASLCLRYYFGLSFHLSERPIVAMISAAGKIGWVLPQFEVDQLADWQNWVEIFAYDEDPNTWQAVFAEAWKGLDLPKRSVIGVEAEQMRLLEFRYLQAAAWEAKFVEADTWLALQRACKDEKEIAFHKKAVQIAEQALTATLPFIRLGMTEKELAGELITQIYRQGADAMLPFQPIVSFGENTANPHAAPSDRRLAAGELILMDWGAFHQGYAADLTRVFIAGKPSPKWEKIAAIVCQANQAAREKAAAGVAAHTVDEVARQVIAQHGYGDRFTHRVGHGLGLAVHEMPYLRSSNDQLLQEGMVFTIEPGIYFNGEGGIRIEDDCMITKEGLITISQLPRELVSVL